MEKYKRDMVIHCPEKEMALFLLRRMHEQGYTWSNTTNLLQIDYWDKYEEHTCYRIDEYKEVLFGTVEFYLNNNYDITEFAELFPGIDEHRSGDIVSSLSNIPSSFIANYYQQPAINIDKLWVTAEWNDIVALYLHWIEEIKQVAAKEEENEFWKQLSMAV